MVGNCAEDETFAHLGCLRENYKLIRQANGMTAVSLTIDLMSLDPVGPCVQCGDLIYKVRKQLQCYIFSLAPRKGGNVMDSAP